MNRFVIAEPNKCIGCRTCEIACTLAHHSSDQPLTPGNFSPRLSVVRTAKITTPITCHHCDDAPCVHACPSQALVYSQDTVQLLQERCVGCKTCVVACPYGAMNMVEVAAPALADAVLVTQRTQTLAQKCDLCIDHEGGPACIPSCPTHALHLIDREQMNATLRQRQEQAALGLAAHLQF